MTVKFAIVDFMLKFRRPKDWSLRGEGSVPDTVIFNEYICLALSQSPDIVNATLVSWRKM